MEALQIPPASLRETLATLGVNFSALARELGVSRRTIQRIANGEQAPSAELAPRLDAWLANPTVSAPRRPQIAAAPPASTPEEPMNDTAQFLDPEVRTHFGFTEDPFEGPESPEHIWQPPSLKRVESIVIDSVRTRRILAVIGEPGMGKSTLMRRITARFTTDRALQHNRLVAPATLDRRQVTSTALAVAIIRDLTGKETSSWAAEHRSELLRATLAEMGRQGVTPVLVIDEAHLLRPAGLLAIKQVWDSTLSWKELAVILVGQPRLRTDLRTDTGLREVAGRTLFVELPSLNEGSAADYLRWRFGRLNIDADRIFAPDAYKALALRGPSPMQLHSIAIASLTYAASMGDPRVTAVHVGRA